MKKAKILFVLTLIVASVVNAQNISERAKKLTPSEDKALVYILPKRPMKPFEIYTVNADKKIIATIRDDNFGFKHLDTGNYTFTIASGLNSFSNASPSYFKVEAGKTYFLQIDTEYQGSNSKLVLVSLDAKKGRKLLNKCDLAANNQEVP